MLTYSHPGVNGEREVGRKLREAAPNGSAQTSILRF